MPAQPVPWRVVVDAALVATAVPAETRVNIPIPEGPNPVVVFPDTPSTMVCVGNVGHGREFREVWDLRTNQKVGTTRGLRTLSENIGGFFRPVNALSADGQRFVTQGAGPFDLVAWDVAHEKQLGVLHPEHADTAGLGYAALAGERIIAFGQATPFQVLSMATPSPMRVKNVPPLSEFDRKSLAISPGGRYVAVFHHNQVLPGMLRFYDVQSGTPAGQLPLPRFEPAGPTVCEGVAFAPDGREVAALFHYRGQTQLVCWDLHQGWLTDHIAFDANLRMIIGASLAYPFAALNGFPIASGGSFMGKAPLTAAREKSSGTFPTNQTECAMHSPSGRCRLRAERHPATARPLRAGSLRRRCRRSTGSPSSPARKS